jgi:hypothetical protein
MSGCENGLTTDPKHEDLGHGADEKPVPQNKCYLVLSDEERAKGFVRPVRSSYVHVGIPGPKFPLQDITAEQKEMWKDDRTRSSSSSPTRPATRARPPGACGRRRISTASARAAARSPRWAARSPRPTRAIPASTARPTAAAAHAPAGRRGRRVRLGRHRRARRHLMSKLLELLGASPARLQALLVAALAMLVVILALLIYGLWWRGQALQARGERDSARDQVAVVSAAAEACSESVARARAIAGAELAAAHRALEDFRRLHAGQRAAVARLEGLLERPAPPGAGCDAAWAAIETDARAAQR